VAEQLLLAEDEELEMQWAELIGVVHGALVAGRRVLWDEVADRISMLLTSPSAFEGEHFLQVRVPLGGS
jgi:hypothetical protein